MHDELVEYNRHIDQHGHDIPEIKSWRWGGLR